MINLKTGSFSAPLCFQANSDGDKLYGNRFYNFRIGPEVIVTV